MNRKMIGLTVVLAASLLLSACSINIRGPRGINIGSGIKGSGNVVTEQRDISGFSAVSFGGVGELTITQGDTESLEVETDDNLMQHITTEVQGSTLEIGLKPNTSIDPSESIHYRLTVRSIDELTLSGAGTIDAASLSADSMTLTLSGAGNLAIDDLQASDLRVTLSGAGNLALAGKVDHQEVTLSGMGQYQAKDLQSATAEVTLSGAGNADVWAEDTLDVEVPGAGSVNYYGSPKVTQNISGVGRVNSRGSK